jgi:hypothetical protein
LGWQPFVPDPDNAGVGKRIHDSFSFKAAFRGLLRWMNKGFVDEKTQIKAFFFRKVLYGVAALR